MDKLDSISSILTNFVLVLIIGGWAQRYQPVRFFFKKLLVVVLFACLGWHLVTALAYLCVPQFFDHVELNIAAVASIWRLGNPIYTLPDAASRYSLLYGPWPYLVNAGFQSLGGSVYFLSKLPGVLNFFILFSGFYLTIRKLNLFDRLLSMGMLSSVLLVFYHFSYWNRPDSFLMTYAFLALMLVVYSEKVGDLATYLGVGLLCGLAANCKIHGVVYFIPPVVYYFEKSGRKINWSYLFFGALLAVAGLLLPFFLKNVGEENYLVWLKLASKHGLDALDFVKTTTFIFCFLLFLFLLKFHKQYRWTYLSLCITGFLVAIVASKPGAGTHHFMPYVPAIIFFAVTAYFDTPIEERRRLNYILAAFVISMGLEAHHRQRRVVKEFGQTKKAKAELREFEKLLKETSGPVEMGYSNSDSYGATFFRLAAIAGKRAGLLIEGSALMDMNASGLSIPDATLVAIKNCQIPTFVFPNEGNPWDITSYYTQRPLYPQEFKDVFAEKYKKVLEGEYYVIYSCINN
ncbi:glycosyltransferase family 39 protein [Bdellovibrio sp. KM01]|uniref:ArnT family glycosyltransferase n=1 Tax=Bdellovibrio sp. KM01 TaxID=2748865 RepID=UPI0015EAF5AA|nr:glycosyltransferase family 39 protein [Bdellovibrio sp. KM01]QLY27027.1 glycosyltransferase family 39 protein [Bdellovibrio sp. KM01]